MNMENICKGKFIDRPNRFIANVELDGIAVRCHMPNPGRMWELLFPGVTIYLRRSGQAGRKTAYDVVGIDRDGVPILLDTQYCNDTAAWLIQERLIPGWESWDLLQREVTVGHSRFDLLLQRGDERFLLEVKSCTLFSHSGAMFPDAVTDRGRRHILHLAELSTQGWHTGVLFLCQWDRAQWFLPDYHTDPAFATAFYESAPQLDWKALALRWDASFCRPQVIGQLAYPATVLVRENHDGGDYMMVLYLPKPRDIQIGSLGIRHFPAGYYVYVGSARRNLAARIARHRRRRKQLHWHLDYFRQQADVVADIPIRTADDLEHDLAASLAPLSDWSMDGFGCSDCHCPSHLFGFQANPVHDRQFMQIVEEFRMNRLEKIFQTCKSMI
jgi:sugar fermentation stimulation protein A